MPSSDYRILALISPSTTVLEIMVKKPHIIAKLASTPVNNGQHVRTIQGHNHELADSITACRRISSMLNIWPSCRCAGSRHSQQDLTQMLRERVVSPLLQARAGSQKIDSRSWALNWQVLITLTIN